MHRMLRLLWFLRSDVAVANVAGDIEDRRQQEAAVEALGRALGPAQDDQDDQGHHTAA